MIYKYMIRIKNIRFYIFILIFHYIYFYLLVITFTFTLNFRDLHVPIRCTVDSRYTSQYCSN